MAKIDLALSRLDRLGVGGDITVDEGESKDRTILFEYVLLFHHEQLPILTSFQDSGGTQGQVEVDF